MSLPPPIPVDPAMLVDQPHPDFDIDSDYEYEYHPTETETVYLTLDLTSLHGPLRPPRRRQPSATAASSASATATNISDEPDAAEFTHVESPSDGLQILGLHTPNPIISYQNQIFSGTWADQLGTDLIFARPDEGGGGGAEEQPGETAPYDPYGTHRTEQPDTPLRHGHTYDLLAAPSIKIIGRKANLISASQSSASDYPPAGLTPPVSTTGIIRAPNHPASNQMRFLERLASLKRSKGETDTVRTVFSTKRIQSDHASSMGGRALGWARTDEQLAEIQRLNELALQGDAVAMAELEALYTRL
ncbi:TFIIIC subunit 6 family protein, partial [Aspergillus fijiensis CBS 313.89]